MIFNVKIMLSLTVKFMLKEGTFNQSVERGDGRNVPDFFAVICVPTLEGMTCTKDRYFSLNRILMLAIGLWPYEQSKLIRLQLTLHYGILGSFIVFQVNECIFSRSFIRNVLIY